MQNLFEEIDEKLISKIKSIQLKAKHLVNTTFAGEYQSAFRGRGMEFEEIREYIPGDDVRSIDWNVTARTGKPYIKVFKDERELQVIFAIDISASTYFGSLQALKSDWVAEIAALLSYTALINNDKVGLVAFSDHIEHFKMPKKGRGHIWQIIRDILSFENIKNKTDLNVPLKFINQVVKRKAIIFLISDFKAENYEQLLRVTAKRHDLIAISLIDPLDLKFPRIGHLFLEDSETNEQIIINTNNKFIMNKYEERAMKKELEKKDLFRSSGIDYIPIDMSKTYIEPIIKFFKRRERSIR